MPLKAAAEDIIADVLAKSWDELKAFEFADRLLFPETLLKLTADGTFESIPICLRIPREFELRKARVDARKWAADEGLDPELDPTLFDDMDTICTLSIAIRNATPPHEPWEPDPRRLERNYDKPSLEALWAKVDAYRAVIDPRVDELDEGDTLMLIAAIAASKNIVPLAGFGGSAQNSFIVSMAVQLQTLHQSKSS
jgi:hypothetical protein